MVFNSTQTDSKFLLLSAVLHACDVGIITDGHEHGLGESRINKRISKFVSNIYIDIMG